MPANICSVMLYCGSWYRGKVTQVLKDEKKVDVFSVDYGDSEFVGYDDVLPMPIVLRRMPFQAIECSCLDVEPLDIQWNDHVCDKFYDLFYNKVFQAQVSWFSARSVLHAQQFLCLYHVTVSEGVTLSGCLSAVFVCPFSSSRQTLLPRYLMNGLSSLDETYRQYLLTPS